MAKTLTKPGPDASNAQNARLRAGLRRISKSKRERQCGVVPCFKGGPAVVATGSPGAWKAGWKGVATCGHIWSCPMCSARIRSERVARALRALTRSGGRWQMVTFTVRHLNGMALQTLLDGLSKAWRGTRQGGRIQRLWSQLVTATIRAIEITHGKHGWHPHVHVLMRTDEWSESDRAALLARWRDHVKRALGPECVPSVKRAIKWSDPVHVTYGKELTPAQQRRLRYVFTLGLEIGGSKHARGASRSHWQVAEDAVKGRGNSVALWHEFCAATRGRRMIELDDRAAAFAASLPPGKLTPLTDSPLLRVVVPIDPEELRGLREVERDHNPGVMASLAGAVRVAQSPETAVRAWLSDTLAVLAYRSRRGNRYRHNEAAETPSPCPRPQTYVAWRAYHDTA